MWLGFLVVVVSVITGIEPCVMAYGIEYVGTPYVLVRAVFEGFLSKEMAFRNRHSINRAMMAVDVLRFKVVKEGFRRWNTLSFLFVFLLFLFAESFVYPSA